MTEHTGRIARGVTPTAQRILFGTVTEDDLGELMHSSQVDRAHLVMLVERGLTERTHARALLRAIDELRSRRFAPLRGLPTPRGLYLLYESHLIEELGSETGGVLHTGRSRNDLNATTLRLRLREPYDRLLREALRLQAILVKGAERFVQVVMPAYTHYQAALPITYGHYLAAVASALGRDITHLEEAGADLERCPLGAGAGGGTSLPIDPMRTSALLGFEGSAANSIDAVASRDFVLRILAAAAVLGVTLSRLATDLLLWTTSEFGFLSLPDELVGSSSMMPQKRNPFLLEHVQGRGTSAIGAFASAAAAMHATPFANAIAVGTEAVSNVWQPLRDVCEAATLARLVVAGATPRPEVMLGRTEEGYTSATELANRLVTEGQMPFRSAHRAVGEIVSAAAENGRSLAEVASEWAAWEGRALPLEELDPASVASVSEYGGGPGAHSVNSCLENLRREWRARSLKRRDRLRRWRTSEANLDEAVCELCR